MSKEVSIENREKIIEIGIAIATMRKIKRMTQEELAKKVGTSRSTLSKIEAPGMATNFSLELFLKIAKVLEIEPIALINTFNFSEKINNL